MRFPGRAAALFLLAFGAHAMAQTSAPTSMSVERGRYLVHSVVACGNCHFQTNIQGVPIQDRPLAGGFAFPGRTFRAIIPNITPDPETGIGKWTQADIVRAIREGVRPDGSLIGAPMPVDFYRHLSDDDANAIAAYLLTMPPVRNVLAEKSRYDQPIGKYESVKSVSAPSPTDKVRYGGYLATVGLCMECHTPRDAQGNLQTDRTAAGGTLLKGPWGETMARNLTPHENGLKNWTDEQIITAIRTGTNREGIKYKPPMPFGFVKNLTDDDVKALVAYLRSLPAQDYPR